MELRKIYEMLKKQAEEKGLEIDEGRLRQQAWILRDRMIFEKSYSPNNAISTSQAGGRIRQQDTSENEYVESDYVDNYFA